MDSEKVIKRDNEYVLHTYARNPIVLEKGHGLYAEGPEGQKYLDFTSGIGVNSLGYCDMTWAEAVSEQAHKLQHTSNLYYTAPCGKLAKKLCKRTGMSKVFFGNSGAEANEACIKLARRYMRTVKQRDAYEIITLGGCFHGRTLGALAATGRESLSKGFTPLPEGFKQVPAGDLEALRAAITPATAAVLVEVVQGEGGVVPLPADYLHGVQALCREKNVLFLCDEVQAGLCRTGKFWAFQNYNLQPDAISMAKSLANGLPMGAMLATDEMARGFEAGSHATTFGGGRQNRGNHAARPSGRTRGRSGRARQGRTGGPATAPARENP